MLNRRRKKQIEFGKRSQRKSRYQNLGSAGLQNNILSEVGSSSLSPHNTQSLVNVSQNEMLRDYESRTKLLFDDIEPVLKEILSHQTRSGFKRWANEQLFLHLGVKLEEAAWDMDESSNSYSFFQDLFSQIVFKQFLRMSEDFFNNDPLQGQNRKEAEEIFREAGIHALDITPCADGRLAHFISYVLRLPYSVARRKAHAGALFDVSESVRNWVFIEHSRFREGMPNNAAEPTRFLKMAVYHYSKVDPSHQGCAAHGSDDKKAAEAAKAKLQDFRQAIENRFGCGSTVETMLIGLNTDNDTLKVHIPNQQGQVCLDRYIETDQLYSNATNMSASEARVLIESEIDNCNLQKNSTIPRPELKKLIAWLVTNNFSQIQYVKEYEQGLYEDIGHAERFIGIGNGFEEVQLRNLCYYSFLDTIEEGVNDIDVGIKIFKGLNVKRGLPIPIIIRCDYDGRVPGSKTRAVEKARRIEKAVHSRYQELSSCGLLQTMGTLRDNTGARPAEKLI